MNFRYRLFLWVSALFLLAGITTYILELVVTTQEMETTRKQLRGEIVELNEKKRENIQGFLATIIGENQTRIDVLLDRLLSYPSQAAEFAPTENNYKRGTWLVASELLDNNKWLDFIQNTNQDKLTSLIIPRVTSLDHSFRVEINDELAWVLMGDIREHVEPYLGIRLHFDTVVPIPHSNANEIVEAAEEAPRAYLLFSLDQLACPSEKSAESPIFTGIIPPIQTNLNAPWTDGTQLDVARFFNVFKLARQYVLQGMAQVSEGQVNGMREWIEKEFRSLGHNLNLATIPENVYKTLPSPFLKKELDDLVMRYDQLYLIWCLAAMNDLQIFGGDLFSPSAPLGIAVHFGNREYGEGIHTSDVFYPTAAFDDEEYFNHQVSPLLTSRLSSNIAIFQPFDLPHIFFGNAAQYQVKENDRVKVGYLTLGMAADGILQRLVIATHQSALLISGGKLMGAFLETGGKMNPEREKSFPIPQILGSRSGVISWEGEEYYYIMMTPFAHLDLHFVLLNPLAKEFALLNSLNANMENIIKEILMSIHLIGFSVLLLTILILHYLSRRITHPITRLAAATYEIAAGRLEGVEIPIPREKDTDEIALLCRNFDHMVKGLQEKEKVKGVLNKVVSQEIAQEILKGNIRLGGEEKKVTILFADIRNFTKMTQNMSPKEVIDLLNGCMNKISHFVDEYGGVIDKYVGDEAMALFGAPVECRDSAHRAILSALGMLEALKKWNEQRRKHNLNPVEIGIGIHTGTVLAGNMGAENRLNYTVLGSNVNFASRLCSAAGRMEILISENTLEEPDVKDKIFCEELPPMKFKGFDKPMIVYRVIGMK